MRERVLLLTQTTYTLGVSAVVLNDARQVLLLRNRYRYSSAWQLPGGFVTRGETMEAAIVRELREETGLAVEVKRQLFAHLARPQHLDVCYLCRVLSGELALDGVEVLDGRFFEAGELPRGLSREDRLTIAEALKSGG